MADQMDGSHQTKHWRSLAPLVGGAGKMAVQVSCFPALADRLD